MKLKQIIFNNFGLKLTALTLAIFVWIIISGKERAYSEKTFEVNVECLNVSKNIDVRSVSPGKVRVKCKGISREINKLSSDNFSINIDLTGTTKSTKLNRFTMDYIDFPETITIESVFPQWIEITVEEFFSKEVTVKIKYSGKSPPGIKIVEKKVTPERVKIFGYKSEIANVATVYGEESIDLAGITQTQTLTMPLKKIKEILRFVDTDKVQVSVVVEDSSERSDKK